MSDYFRSIAIPIAILGVGIAFFGDLNTHDLLTLLIFLCAFLILLAHFRLDRIGKQIEAIDRAAARRYADMSAKMRLPIDDIDYDHDELFERIICAPRIPMDEVD